MSYTNSPSKLQIARTCPSAYQELSKGSGLSDEMILRAEIEVEYDNEALAARLRRDEHDHAAVLTPALCFTYHNPDGSRRNFSRIKSLRPRTTADGKTIKYESPLGEPSQLYFVPGTYKQLMNPSIPIVIDEGEKKTLASNQHGILSVGVSGAWNWSAGTEIGPYGQKIRRLIPDFDLIPWAGRRVTCRVDSDAADKANVERGFEELASLLRERGAIVSVLILPSEGGRKVGADDFHLMHDAKAMVDLIEASEKAYHDRKCDREDAERWKAMNRPKSAQVVTGKGVSRYSTNKDISRVNRTSPDGAVLPQPVEPPELPKFSGYACPHCACDVQEDTWGDEGSFRIVKKPCKSRPCPGCRKTWERRKRLWYGFKIEQCTQQLYFVTLPRAKWDSVRKQLSRKSELAEYLCAEMREGELDCIVSVPVKGAAEISKDEAKQLMESFVTDALMVKRPHIDGAWHLPKDRKKTESRTVPDEEAIIARNNAYEAAVAHAMTLDGPEAEMAMEAADAIVEGPEPTKEVNRWQSRGRTTKSTLEIMQDVLGKYRVNHRVWNNGCGLSFLMPSRFRPAEQEAFIKELVQPRYPTAILTSPQAKEMRRQREMKEQYEKWQQEQWAAREYLEWVESTKNAASRTTHQRQAELAYA